MRLGKKGQFAETMIVIAGIILLIAAVIAVSLSRGSIPSQTNSVAIETLKIGQTFDSLEITVGKVVEEEVGNARIVESILGSGCSILKSESADLIKYDEFSFYSEECSTKNVLKLYTKEIEEKINNKIKSLESVRKDLSASGYTFFNSYSYSSGEDMFMDNNFVVYASPRTNTLDINQQYDVFVLGKTPLQITKTKAAVWELDARRNINFKLPLNADAQDTLFALNAVSEFNVIVSKEIIAFMNQKNKDIAENAKTDLKIEDLSSRINTALSESQILLGISAVSGNSNVGKKTYWELVVVDNELWLVFPNIRVIDRHSLN